MRARKTKKSAMPASEPEPKVETAPLQSTRVESKPSSLDFFEQLLVLGFYMWFFWNFGSGFMEHPSLDRAAPLLAETITVFFLLIRRPAKAIAASPLAWLLALVPTVLPLLVLPVKPGEGYFAGEPILLAGMLGAIIVKISLGRSFGLVAANRGLQSSGPYRLVRHPMYACYLLTHIGIWLLNPTLWNLGVYAANWTLQIARILVEEKYLSQDPRYVEYRKIVRYRLIPGVF